MRSTFCDVPLAATGLLHHPSAQGLDAELCPTRPVPLHIAPIKRGTGKCHTEGLRGSEAVLQSQLRREGTVGPPWLGPPSGCKVKFLL